MISPQLSHEAKIEAVKAVPAPVGFVVYSLTLQEWVAVATLIYIAIQTLILIHKHLHWIKNKKPRQEK